MIGIRRDVIDNALSADSLLFVKSLILFLCVSLLSVLSSYVLKFLLEHFNHKRASSIDKSLVKKVERLSYPVLDSYLFHSLFEKAKNTSELASSVSTSIGRCLTDSVTIVFSLISISLISVPSALVLSVALVFYAALVFYQGAKTENFWSLYRERMKRANYLSSILTRGEYAYERKIFDYNEYVEKECQKELSNAEHENCKTGKRRLRMELTLTISSALYTIVVIFMLLAPLNRNLITIGGFISLFYALQTLSKVSGDFCSNLFIIHINRKWSGAFHDFMALQEENGIKSISEIETIEFKNVSFSYPESNTCVLKNVNFKLTKGGHYALVGENGSGKSTIVKLMLGLYKPSFGEVLIDGIAVSDLSLESRMKLLGVVFQSVAHYPISIRENVSLSKDDMLNDDDISDIFTKLEFDLSSHDLDLPLTASRNNGSGLSGGEWQKLAIARVLVSSSPFVIMDEPNAALDPISEMDMYQAYGKILSQRTSFLITHRLGAVRNVDTILVLKDGEITAEGSHSFLIENCSYYRELYDTQRDFYVKK